MEHQTKKQRPILSIGLLVLSTLIARSAFLWWKPEGAVSVDVHSWEVVAEILRRGGNPYEQTTFLNWPPVWPLIIYSLSRASAVAGTSFRDLLFALLSLLDCALVIVVYLSSIHAFHSPVRRAFLTSLFGIALSPIPILLSCQHGNFDVVSVLCILGALLVLNNAIMKQSTSTWLRGCLFLGIAGMTKTFPLVLAPLFIFSFPSRSRAEWLWASLLIVLPWLLAVGVIYVAAPDAVWRNVVMYNSVPSRFGLNTIFTEVFGDAGRAAQTAFFVALMMGGYSTVIAALRKRYHSSLLVVAAAFVLGVLPVFGPGFGPQYILWILPLWTAIFPVLSLNRKLVVMACYLVATVCYLYLYAFVALYGASVGPPLFFITGYVVVVQVALYAALLVLVLLGFRICREAQG